MEVRARYILIGIFSVAVILTGFVFVYWLDSSGGLNSRVSYRIRFDSPVAGLLKGSAVLFNGVRVGEVTELSLVPSEPSIVDAAIAIDRSVPVRADTSVLIDFQGLAGAPAISMVGGTPSLPLLSVGDAAARVLTAEKDAGQSLTKAGQIVLRHLDQIVTENAAPLKSGIAGIDKFFSALARNSEKVDGILAGLERLTGGAPQPVVRVYSLSAVESFSEIHSVPQVQLLVAEPRALAVFESEQILVANGEQTNLEKSKWPDMLPRVVQARIVESFEKAKYLSVMGGAPEVVPFDIQLQTEIRHFEIDASGSPKAVVELVARLIDKERGILHVRTFTANVPAESLDASVAAMSLDRAFKNVARDLVTWVCRTL
jgi:phospholipid/cholesterol/gamma-HCH transport system substrate-binding protein